MSRNKASGLNRAEIKLISFALNVDAKQQPRRFPFDVLKVAAKIGQKLTACAVDGQIQSGPHNVEFTSDERKLIVECVTERPWPIGDAEAALSVVDKLSKK